eukprot:6176217-Prymnesium_polylepis.1
MLNVASGTIIAWHCMLNVVSHTLIWCTSSRRGAPLQPISAVNLISGCESTRGGDMRAVGLRTSASGSKTMAVAASWQVTSLRSPSH